MKDYLKIAKNVAIKMILCKNARIWLWGHGIGGHTTINRDIYAFISKDRRIDPMPPEQEVTGSNPVGRTQ